MALRAKKPTNKTKRLKLFMYGDAGVGKTTAGLQLPMPYIIDAERGTENYHKKVNKIGGAVFNTTEILEVIDEVRKLSTEEHDFKTLVIDPITPLYFDLIDKCELEVGSEFGRHYGEANKYMKRLINLIMRLDMNVVVTAHAKVVYGDDMKKLGITFDGWKKLDYIFDLVLELRKQTPTKRYAKVVKTRIESFPDGETFEWNYDSLTERFSQVELERDVDVITTATAAQVKEIETLSEKLVDGSDAVTGFLRRAGVQQLLDLTEVQAQKVIDYFIKSLEPVGATK
jgi:hypothetical protein